MSSPTQAIVGSLVSLGRYPVKPMMGPDRIAWDLDGQQGSREHHWG
ncbi:MAG: hypothetical protein HYY20_09185 [Candidatus Tectomicrobia bacterium]|uniref:Uncharacterized protein n=1 Tax=Tectimicrobiota bacterium TaxID=2528274 RepID=A0A932CQ19_UNCTE|nr:hypothetical protein [Candidatus Tectomicrobia bacterium]